MDTYVHVKYHRQVLSRFLPWLVLVLNFVSSDIYRTEVVRFPLLDEPSAGLKNDKREMWSCSSQTVALVLADSDRPLDVLVCDEDLVEFVRRMELWIAGPAAVDTTYTEAGTDHLFDHVWRSTRYLRFQARCGRSLWPLRVTSIPAEAVGIEFEVKVSLIRSLQQVITVGELDGWVRWVSRVAVWNVWDGIEQRDCFVSHWV
ncbi:hypothetical protein QBC43DRAFT_337165 [Cladorrhinum sp. PSN259]|nr:hypothetical protein QBC43DRAFT_337165 [Cladorrhinum sp. PSN259]